MGWLGAVVTNSSETRVKFEADELRPGIRVRSWEAFATGQWGSRFSARRWWRTQR